MTRDDILGQLRQAAASVLDVPEADVVETARFGDDLDADSLDMVELVMALEEQLDLSVPEEELEGIVTVADAVDLLAGKLAAKA